MRDVQWPIALGVLAYVQGLSGASASPASDGMTQSVEVCFQYGRARHAVVAPDVTLLATLERRFFASTNAAEERAAIASSVAELDNGRTPHGLELPRWRRGWKPEAHTP